jgi:hypothetical protein
MEVKAKISIGRLFGGDGVKQARIEIVDEVSRVHFLDAIMSVEDFARALFGESSIPIDVTLRGLDLIGMRHEHKRELVPYVRDYNLKGEALKAAQDVALAPFEVDGWKGYRDDMENGHRRSKMKGTDGYLVSFHRHVPNV